MRQHRSSQSQATLLVLSLLSIVSLLSVSFSPVPTARAQGVTLTANVLSGVSANTATFTSDIIQLPADGKSIVVLTAVILSKESQALPNKEVVISSNRGEVDTILCYSGEALTNERKTTTDTVGKARCVASSEVPGNATFTAVADGITLDDKPTVTFTPLPFLTNLTIKVNLPGGGQLTILEPVKPKPSKPINERLVNTDVELQLPFWILLIIILLLLTEPILIALILRLYRKVRLGFEDEKRFLAKEQEHLATIYQLESQVVQTATAIEAEVRQIEATTALPNFSTNPSPASNQPLSNSLQSPDTEQSPPTQQF